VIKMCHFGNWIESLLTNRQRGKTDQKIKGANKRFLWSFLVSLDTFLAILGIWLVFFLTPPLTSLSLPLSLSLFRQVNLIHLHPKDEKLRDTIFYQIFQNSLLLDKETDAVIYRNLLIQNKIFPIPNLYSLDGVCLRGDGLFHPTQDRLPGKLNYIFGEKSVTDLSEFRNLDRELNLIQEIKSFLQQENEICLQKSQRENAINELHEEIERIENRHGMKRRKRIRKASELMYEEMHEEEEEEREGEEGCSLSQHNRKKRTHK
jgi:hypothetical protein